MESAQGPISNEATAVKQVEDPLIASLPPNTDYITYLTILEYQLTPQNLPTLNRLLQDDDGTLAAEIGWDLLKLILPILRVKSGEAGECLDIIARRGNPREVIIRVAEELETLGQDESDIEADPAEAKDGLPTFAGEAPRVHLGDITLKGMPESTKSESQAQHTEYDEDGPDGVVEELKLQALLRMLGLLHPRIKTQHPSRFLATSLPAALGAYRRLSMNTESTSAFLGTLTKLATKKRPALPPRVSTSNVLSRTSTNASAGAEVVSAPLPDPESKTEKDTASQAVASNEAAINERLIQAVFLEIIEEYTATSCDPQPPLTARLRAKFEPNSITSTRRSQLDTLTANEQAKRADSLRRRFVTTAQDLKVDTSTAIRQLDQAFLEQPETETEEVNEYPTSPSQIPFSTTGVLLAYCAHQYLQAISQQTPGPEPAGPEINNKQILEAIDQQYETDTRLRQSTPAIDSILSLLYTIFCIPVVYPAGRPSSSVENETLLLATYNILQDIFTSCPDADLRDNAYHIATHLLHAHCQRATRVKIIKGILEADVAAAVSPIHEAQAGNLKSIAVDWLKDEIYPTQAMQTTMSRIRDQSDRGLPLSTLVELGDLLFPAKQIERIPVASPDPAQEQTMELFAAELPFYISSLNLLCLVAKNQEEDGTDAGGAGGASTAPTTDTGVDIVLVRGEVMLAKLEEWKEYLVNRMSKGKTADTGEEGGIEVDGVSLPDIFALEDAVGRAREVLPSESQS
ncbi:YAP1-binding protein 1 [Knufia obscura]|uniref:YAP1-binding protein 1 n=1 Tax=Knufia obscura TaxID=1635080 RepID=A0ABR0RDQ0_9EURO|nr:YAP1-binding protein 1 [Knufia obscura]